MSVTTRSVGGSGSKKSISGLSMGLTLTSRRQAIRPWCGARGCHHGPVTTHRAGRAPLDVGLVIGLGALAVTVAVSFLSGIQLAAGFGGTAIVASLLTT